MVSLRTGFTGQALHKFVGFCSKVRKGGKERAVERHEFVW